MIDKTLAPRTERNYVGRMDQVARVCEFCGLLLPSC